MNTKASLQGAISMAGIADDAESCRIYFGCFGIISTEMFGNSNTDNPRISVFEFPNISVLIIPIHGIIPEYPNTDIPLEGAEF